MRHFFYIFSFLTIGLTACTGCTKKDTSTPVCTGPDCVQSTVPVVVPTTPDAGLPPPDAGLTKPVPSETPDYITYSGEGWELAVLQEWDQVVVEDEEFKPALVLTSEIEHNLIIFVKDPFPGTAPEYVLGAVRGFAEEGVTINSTTQVEINGNRFIVLDTSRGEARIWFWVSVKDGFGYALSCGGPAAEDHHEAVCKDVANSLKIK